ncbi:MAG: ion transporter [Candidatus Muiribacteriota bacterium]
MASENDNKKTKAKVESPYMGHHRAWDGIILFSVSAMFIIFVLKQLFVVESYERILQISDFIIWLIFMVDLLFIYVRYREFKPFVKNAWLDIIAVIPFGLLASGLGQLGRLAKLGRLVKILRIFAKAGKAGKVAKFAHLNKMIKFFSEDSSFNKYIYQESKSNKRKSSKGKNKKK